MSAISKNTARLRFLVRDPKKAGRRAAQIGARTVWRGAKLPPRIHWVAALPVAAHGYEARWDLKLRRTPIITAEEHCRRTGMKDIEEVVHCSLCGDGNVQPLFEPRNDKKGWHYHVVRCPTCSFLYRLPGIKPERLGELYSGRYDKFLTGHYGSGRQRRYKLVMKAFSPLFDEGGGRRLFDFGCGSGSFLEIAHERGFDGYGVDLSKSSIDYARQHPYGQNAYFGSPMEVPEIAAGGFDLITMWSVLAHLPKPVEDLTMLRGLLGPQGALMILTVNANSIYLKSMADDWNGFTENHLKFFSPQTLPILLRRAGFGAVVIRPMYGDTIEAGTTTMTSGQIKRVKRNVERRGNQGQMMRAVAFADPASIPAALQRDAIAL
jgi:SAM-dependent methyltransferase